MGKRITGILCLGTLGFAGIGCLYGYRTLDGQVAVVKATS